MKIRSGNLAIEKVNLPSFCVLPGERDILVSHKLAEHCSLS